MDPNTTPALEPPPGEVSNLHDPYSLRVYMYITASLALTLSTAAVILRIYTKARVTRSVQFEEYILMLCQLGNFAFTGVMIYAVQLGQGTHQWNISIAHVQRLIQLANIIEIIYCPTILGAKTAMVLQTRRFFVVNSRGKVYWLHEVLLWTNVACYLALMLSFICACVPRNKLWEPTIPGKCVSSNGILIASSVLNVISDVAMLLLPLWVVKQLQLPRKIKIMLSAIFGTTVLASISSTCRLIYGVKLTHTEDFTWGIMPVGLWAVAEIASIIIASSFPMLPGFVKYIKDQARSGQGQSSSGKSNYNVSGPGQSQSVVLNSIKGQRFSLNKSRDRNSYHQIHDFANGNHNAGDITKTIHIQTQSDPV
ncbi:hypothetical protein BGW36DRAFT_357077 [Talaromyces proteolyticus]|uniref:Rhodopsin domain-containing protein n=1 Tax=Talaromyces proteolyticus TaxID=1131652 RepID=A0AAD4PXU2_9EURO|nr:uncharacterized protein BGW36DRAFT_357077 [Talaromyces proteolyticus]KAH8700415.1 hypothetical protein BGW36DRAFT_357077 [Talaromyces proteolyticus]